MSDPAMAAMYRARLEPCLVAILGAIDTHLAATPLEGTVGDVVLPSHETSTAIECLNHLGLNEDARRLKGWLHTPGNKLAYSLIFRQQFPPALAVEEVPRVRRLADNVQQLLDAITAPNCCRTTPVQTESRRGAATASVNGRRFIIPPREGTPGSVRLPRWLWRTSSYSSGEPLDSRPPPDFRPHGTTG